MQVLMTLENVPWLQDFLKTAAPEVIKAVGIENRNTAFAIQREARANLIRSGHVDKGDLLRSISVEGKDLRWRVGLDDRAVTSRARVGAGRRGGTDEAHTHPWLYGIWYEKGFVTKRISASPYMAPAFDKQEAGYQSRQEAVVNEVLARISA
jgi:hypothetical protein